MMVTRIGDLGRNQQLTGTFLATQARVRADEQAVASGKAVNSYSQIGSTTGQLLRAEDARQVRGGFIEQNERLAVRMQVTDAALGSVIEVAERARAMLVQRQNGAAGSSVAVDVEAAQMLGEIAGQLNETHDGAYLFAGSRTDTPPVVLPTPPITTVDPSLYYQGDEVRASSRIDVGQELEHGVLASAAPFAELIGALGLAAEGHAANDHDQLADALDQLNQAFDGLVELRATLGVNTARVEATTEAHRSGLHYLDETISSIVNTDLAETMTRLSQDQASLEAAYLVTGRLNSLSLADYLR